MSPATSSLFPKGRKPARFVPHGRHLRSPWVRRLCRSVAALAALAALVLAAAVAGIAVTSAWPTTATTSSFTATVQLSAQPEQLSTVHAPTLFGDLDLHFDGIVPAPGITAVARVSDTITTVLASKDLSIPALMPSQHELDEAVTAMLWAVGGKYAAGVLLTCALVALALRHWRSRGTATRPWRQALGIPALAGVLALAGAGGAAWSTFQPGRLETVQTDGLLGYVRSNTQILSDVETRSAQAQPYVKNMLALSAALQERFVPPELASPASVKLLLVSDLHGANQYPLMKQIVDQEGITAVVDTGDLVNFGHVPEAEAARMFAGIESLGVPYLWVRGNHDAAAADDYELVERMTRVPNAVVLEPRPGTYRVADVGGLRLAGFNDPRWFGDDGGGPESQTAATERFVRAMDDLRAGRLQPTAPTTSAGATASPRGGTPLATPTPAGATTDASAAATEADRRRGLDVLVAHEPYAAEKVSAAGIRLNGHMHSAGLEGNRVQAGTFTGGGIVSHYIEGEGDGELSGQPYAFDVLSFGGDCRLQTLTRYSFRDLLEGRPVYDDVRVINGEAVQSPLPSEGRVCRADAPLVLQTVEAGRTTP